MKDKEASAPGLSEAEAAFALLVYRCSNFKLSNYEAWTNEEEDSKPLWPRLEELGLIFSVGSYKWAPTQKLIDMLTAALTRASAATVGETNARRPLTADEVAAQYDEQGIHIGSGLPAETCPCGLCKKVREAAQQQQSEPVEADPYLEGIKKRWPSGEQQAEPGAEQRAAFWQEDDNGLLSRVPESITQAINDGDMPIGYAEAMPYCADWTQAVFEADKVPEGTPLYLKTAQSSQRAGVAEDADMRGKLYFALVGAEDQLRRIAKLIGEDHDFIDKGRTIEMWADMAKSALLAAAPTQQQENK